MLIFVLIFLSAALIGGLVVALGMASTVGSGALSLLMLSAFLALDCLIAALNRRGELARRPGAADRVSVPARRCAACPAARLAAIASATAGSAASATAGPADVVCAWCGMQNDPTRSFCGACGRVLTAPIAGAVKCSACRQGTMSGRWG